MCDELVIAATGRRAHHDGVKSSSAPEHRVVIVVPPAPQLLDVVGPAEVFQTARQLGGPAYRVETAGLGSTTMRSAGVGLATTTTVDELTGPIDTLVIAGGFGARTAADDPGAIEAVRRVAQDAHRVASVCTGAFLLAATGLLAGRRAVTHWAWCDELAARHPDIEVDPEPIFVRHGQVWTSAGVTAGMDLVLALVADDHDDTLAHEVARWLVLFTRRPGGQAQFSTHISMPAPRTLALADTLGWAVDHLDADLSVPALARRAAMSPRTFARRFVADVGVPPGAWVARVRLEAAQQALQQSEATLPVVARRCGFGTPSALHRAFRARLGTTPATYRQHFRGVGRHPAA